MTWRLTERLYQWFGQRFKTEDATPIQITSDEYRIHLDATDAHLMQFEYSGASGGRSGHRTLEIEAENVRVHKRDEP